MEQIQETTHSWHDYLKSIAQRRRQGELHIKEQDSELSVFFVQGKIVDASFRHSLEEPKKLEHVLIERLSVIGLLPEDFTCDQEIYSSPLKALYAESTAHSDFMQEDVFRRAVKHALLELLYRIPLQEPEDYGFAVKVVEYDKQFSPQVCMPQLLLDLSHIDECSKTYVSHFNQDIFVSRKENVDVVLAVEERVLFDALTQPMKISDLQKKSLLCCYHFQDALFSLDQKGLLNHSNDLAHGQTSEHQSIEHSLDEMVEVTKNAEKMVSQVVKNLSDQNAALDAHNEKFYETAYAVGSQVKGSAQYQPSRVLIELVSLFIFITCIGVSVLLWTPLIESF